MVWGGMRSRGLTMLRMLPTGQTVTSEYYINQILAKEGKALTSTRPVTGGPKERDDTHSGWSTGSHFKDNSDMAPKESPASRALSYVHMLAKGFASELF